MTLVSDTRATRLLDPAGAVRLRLAAAGDIGVIGSMRTRARSEGFDAMFAAVAPTFRAADLAFANLEMPVAEASWVEPGRSAEFWHDREVVDSLARAGVRVVSLANNHVMDCGPRGLARTLEACAAAGIQAVGAGVGLAAARRPAILSANDLKVGVLAYATGKEGRAGDDSPGFAPLDEALVRDDVARVRAEVDVLVVSVHWGSMYVDFPPPYVTELAQVLEGLGIDVVLGHHPHVTQGVVRRGKTIVLFSLGDTVFNPRAGDFEAEVAAELRPQTGLFTALIADTPGVEYLPLVLDQDGVPGAAPAEKAAWQVDRLRRLDAALERGEAGYLAHAAPQLLKYELQSLTHYLRTGRIDKVLALIGSIRPRHLPVLWSAVRRMRS